MTKIQVSTTATTTTLILRNDTCILVFVFIFNDRHFFMFHINLHILDINVNFAFFHMKCGILYKTEITSKNKSEFLHSNIKNIILYENIRSVGCPDYLMTKSKFLCTSVPVRGLDLRRLLQRQVNLSRV